MRKEARDEREKPELKRGLTRTDDASVSWTELDSLSSVHLSFRRGTAWGNTELYVSASIDFVMQGGPWAFPLLVLVKMVKVDLQSMPIPGKQPEESNIRELNNRIYDSDRSRQNKQINSQKKKQTHVWESWERLPATWPITRKRSIFLKCSSWSILSCAIIFNCPNALYSVWILQPRYQSPPNSAYSYPSLPS